MTVITINEVTTKSLTGTGAFDEMMQAVDLHLAREQQSGRITGNDYATVYLGALQATLAQAVTFVLQKQQASQLADKTAEELLLITQKTRTEAAQILDTVDGNSVVGVIGKQKTLYQAQTDGFARDAEQKLSKIMADVYAVQRGTDESLIPPTGAENADISLVLQKAAEGIGVTTSV